MARTPGQHSAPRRAHGGRSRAAGVADLLARRAYLELVDHQAHPFGAAGDLLRVVAVFLGGNRPAERHLAVARVDMDADAAEVRGGDEAGLDAGGEHRVAGCLARHGADPLIDVVRPLLDGVAEVVRVLLQLLAGLVEIVLDLLVVDVDLLVAAVVAPDVDGGVPATAEQDRQRSAKAKGHGGGQRSGLHRNLLGREAAARSSRAAPWP